MANCPNCGRSTARTKDWCCQWCGYPLFSGAFKTLNKTFKELKAERLALLPAEEAKVTEKINKVEAQNKTEKKNEELKEERIIEQPAPRIIPASTSESSMEIRQIRKVRYDSAPPVRRRIIRRRRTMPTSEPEVIEYVEYIDEQGKDSEVYYEESEEESGIEEEYEEAEPRIIRKPALESRYERKVKPEYKSEAEHPVKQEIIPKNKPVSSPEPETDETNVHSEGSNDQINKNSEGNKEEPEENNAEVSTKTDRDEEETVEVSINKITEKPESKDNSLKVPEPQNNPLPAQALMEISVSELVSAYETEGPAADARFTNKVIKITGLVGKIEIKEASSVYALVLETPDANPLRQTVRCVFGRENRETLQRISRNQTVSVQGKYDGSIINISMRDCVLV